MWVGLLVLEALVGTNALEALKGLDGGKPDDGFVMFDHEVESMFYGLRWMASRIFMLGICNEGKWMKRDFVQPFYR